METASTAFADSTCAGGALLGQRTKNRVGIVRMQPGQLEIAKRHKSRRNLKTWIEKHAVVAFQPSQDDGMWRVYSPIGEQVTGANEKDGRHALSEPLH